jgi:glycine/D-amino acid oxidase-like deaminating enzyme
MGCRGRWCLDTRDSIIFRNGNPNRAGTGTGHPHRTLFIKNGTYNIVSRSFIHQADRQWEFNFYLGSHTEFVGFENRITLEKISQFTRIFTHGVPLLARLRALRFFAGFRPICEDNLPIIGPVPGCPKLIIASGHGRTGVRYSASTGKAVSELIVDEKTEHPMDAFAVDRFVEKLKDK